MVNFCWNVIIRFYHPRWFCFANVGFVRRGVMWESARHKTPKLIMYEMSDARVVFRPGKAHSLIGRAVHRARASRRTHPADGTTSGVPTQGLLPGAGVQPRVRRAPLPREWPRYKTRGPLGRGESATTLRLGRTSEKSMDHYKITMRIFSEQHHYTP